MSKKKKHHSAPRSVGRGNARTEQIANYTSKQKKLNPTARNLLLCNGKRIGLNIVLKPVDNAACLCRFSSCSCI